MSAISPSPAWRNLLLDWLLPQRCLTCETWLSPSDQPRLGVADWLCDNCLQSLEPIHSPCCPRCGEPLQGGGEAILPCGDCLKNPPEYDFALAGYRAKGSWRTLIHHFKYGSQRGLAQLLVTGLQRCLEQPRLETLLHQDSWHLIAVPMSRWRQWRRGFNQSHELARCLSRRSGLPLLEGALQRKHSSRNQASLGRMDRLRNLAGRILCPQPLEAKNLILVDDVLTTGATASACAKALRQAGAEKVVVICAARG